MHSNMYRQRQRRQNLLDFLGRSLNAWVICLVTIPVWFAAALLESEFFATLAALIGIVLVAGWWKTFLSDQKEPLAFLKIGGVSLLMIISLSWLISGYFNWIVLDQSVTHTLRFVIGVSFPAYAAAVIYALMFASVLAAIGEAAITKRMERFAHHKLLLLRRVPVANLMLLVVAFSLVEATLVVAGVIGYRAYTVDGYDSGQMAWFVPLLETMFSVHVLLNALIASRYAEVRSVMRRRALSLVMVASALIVLFVYFTKGRSPFVMAAFLHFFWFCIFLGRLPKLSTGLMAMVLIVPVLYTGVILNNFLRGEHVGAEAIANSSILDVVGSSVGLLESDTSLRQSEELRSAQNLSFRPLVVNPLAMCMALESGQKRFLYGENLLNSFIWAIPSAFFPDKRSFPIQEDILYPNFGVGAVDIADSAYLYAYADFGYFGLLIYPLIISLVWFGLLFVVRTRLCPPFAVAAIISLLLSFFTISMGEASVTSWFSAFRSALFCLPLALLITYVFRLRPRSGLEVI